MKDESDPNAAVEIHDSTLRQIESGGDDVVAVIDAYVHRSAGHPGVDAGTGWSQSLQLRFFKGKASGSVATIPMELLDGRLVLSGETFSNTIPMPLNHMGPSRIELESWNDARIIIESDGVSGHFVGPPVHVEEFEP
jgi:hypothetical protein